MIVRLSVKMREEIWSVGGPLHRDWIDERSDNVSERMWDVLMPPIGWKTLSDKIIAKAFTPAGFRKGGKETAGAALRRISHELAKLEGHPAFRGQAMPGVHSERFLCWSQSPYPQLNVEAAVLIPQVQQFRGMTVTAWRMFYPTTVEDLPPDLDPAAHWDFIQPADTPAVLPAP